MESLVKVASTEVTDSEQWRLLADHKKHGRIEVFKDAYHYSEQAIRTGYAAHKDLGSNPEMQRRRVRVTFEYEEWETVDD